MGLGQGLVVDLSFVQKTKMPLYKYLSSLPSMGFLGSGSLLSVLQPFRPLTDAPDTEAFKKKKLNLLYIYTKNDIYII